MFGKLCKYEWRYMLRIFLPMWALVLVLSVVNRFTLFLDNTSGASERFVTLALLALVFACGALGIVAIVMIVPPAGEKRYAHQCKGRHRRTAVGDYRHCRRFGVRDYQHPLGHMGRYPKYV